MYYDLLAHFIDQSTHWSKVKRGSEVFQHASGLFQELFQVDSGFFVYKKRIPSSESEPLKIYNTWGKFEKSIGNIQSFFDKNKPILQNLLELKGGQWIDAKEIPFEIEFNIQQIGMWELCSRGEVIGGILLARSLTKKMNDEHVISVCAKQISLILDMLLAWRTADELSRYDLLTGVLNRRGIFDVYETLIANAERSGSTVMIGLIDIDNFKNINDFHGHPEGDRVLTQVAKTLKNTTRSGDLVGRLGGDEFVLIMQTNEENSHSIEQRIEELFPMTGGYTVSVGFSVWNVDGPNWDTCYKVADQRLYRRKFEKNKNDYRR